MKKSRVLLFAQKRRHFVCLLIHEHCSKAATIATYSVCYYVIVVNAHRICEPDGHWNGYSNYSMCKPLKDKPVVDEQVDYTFYIYLSGYSLSLIALFIACTTFLYFK